MVQKAFDILDPTGKGAILAKDIINLYDVSKDKDFISGLKTKE